MDHIIILLLIGFGFFVGEHTNILNKYLMDVPFVWFAQTSTTQQTKNKFYTRNTKRTNMQTQNKSIMIHTRMIKKITTISTTNSHILPKKKILQTEFTNITVIFRTVKAIKIMSNEWLYCETLLLKIVLFIVIFTFSSLDCHFYYDL